MKQFKYLIYLLAAIAAPLWLALTNMGGKSDSKTTFALDSANFQLISKIIEKHDSSISVREKSNGVDKNKSSIEDSLILLLTNALLRGPQKSIDGDGLKIISSTIEKSSKELQAVLMSEKSIKVDVDPITVNHSSPPLEPKIDSSRNVVYNYDLNENGPYPLLKIKATSNENKLFIILSNQSKKFHVVIDTLIPIFDNAYDFSILDSMFIKGSLGSKKLTSKQIQVAFSSAKDLQVKKDTSKLQPYVTINYNLDGNLIDPGNHSIIRLNSPSNNFQQFYIILYYETSRTNLLGSTFTRFVKHRVPVFIN